MDKKPVYFLWVIFLFMMTYPSSGQHIHFEQSELEESIYRKRTRKIFNALKVLETDTVFHYSAELLELLSEGKLTDAQEVDVYFVLGKVFQGLNDDVLSNQYITQALNSYLDKGFGPSRYLTIMYSQLAVTLPKDSASQRSALRNYRKSMSISRQLGESLYIAGNLNNIGLLHFQLNNLDSAQIYLDSAMTVYKTQYVEFHEVELSIRDNMASLYLKKGFYEEALMLFEENRRIAKHNSLIQAERRIARITSSLIGMAEVQLHLGNLEEARKLLRQTDSSLSYLPFKRVSEYIIHSNELQLELAERTNNDSLYKEVSKTALHQLDSLNNIELTLTSRIAAALAGSQLDLANLRIIHQKQQLNESRLNYGLATAGLIIILLTFAIIAIVLRKRNQMIKARESIASIKLKNVQLEEEKLKMQLGEQGQDLNELSGQLIIIRELNKEITNKLKIIEGSEIEKQKEELRNVSQLVRRNLQEIEITGALQKNLERVNSSFYNKLQDLSNNSISRGEREIAALLRLGMTDLQISELRGTGETAVRVARSRIKRKLPLSENQDLVLFLMKL
ncbi:MAG: hypothetical protein HWE14_05090 [Flavobacteriia bacterium]|nr:hypothetical protein [Flavobacteriia bacterium]